MELSPVLKEIKKNKFKKKEAGAKWNRGKGDLTAKPHLPKLPKA